MAAITIELEPETERLLRDKAESVETLDEMLKRFAREAAESGQPLLRLEREVKLTHEEFARRLRALADGPPLPSLPDDFSRADIYDDHD